MQSKIKPDVLQAEHSYTRKGIYCRYIKRPMDIILSFLALVIFSPLMLIIAILVRIKLGKPVVFKQNRPGLNERIFTLYKFRTMTDEKDKDGVLLPDALRLTTFGKKLRSTSLDELPELVNILKGEMSIVGPRPQLVRDMVFMTDNQRRRHSVRPGLTGLAQICGRNGITWENKLQMDLEYIRNITFLGDMRIILVTARKIIKKEGISTEGMATAEDLGDYLLRCGYITENIYIAKQEESDRLISMGK